MKFINKIAKIEVERDHYKQQAEYWKERYEEAWKHREIEHTKRIEYYGAITKLVLISGKLTCEEQAMIYDAFRESDKFIDSFYKKKGS